MGKTNSFLNVLTVVGLVFVSFFIVAAVYLIIAYAAGYFNKDKIPIVGLQFTTENNVVISENAGTYTLKIVSTNAEITEDAEGNKIYTDPSTPSEVRLIVRNSQGTIISENNKIIDAPETVMTNTEFTITALVNPEDNANFGGDCYIYAETVDTTYRVKDALHIFVDVPIERITLSATNESGTKYVPIDDETQGFIYEDKIQLVPNVFPKRALNPHDPALNLPNKTFSYTSADTDKAIIDPVTGLITIKYNPTGISDEPVTAPTDNVRMNIMVNSIYAQNSDTVTSHCTLYLFPIQLNEIKILNTDYSSNNKVFETILFNTSNPLKLSVEETGDASIINLDVFLEPTIYNADVNSNPLKNKLNDFTIDWVSDLEIQPGKQALEIQTEIVNGKQIWIINALRSAEPNETIDLIFGVQGHDTKDITRKLNIVATTPEGFTYLNDDETTNTQRITNIEISKYDEGFTAPSGEIQTFISQLKYNYTNDGFLTYEKFVFFINPDNNVNMTESKIIEANEFGELFLESGGWPAIKALGAGSITVTPYVIRTDERGIPLDRNYRELTNAKGIYMYNEEAKDESYVAYASFDSLTVTVTELLKQVKLYVDSDLTTEIVTTADNPVIMGTTLRNKYVVYIKPNSSLALPENALDYSNWSYTYGDLMLNFNVNTEQGPGKFDSTESDYEFNFNGTKNSTEYQRYMSMAMTASDEAFAGVTLYLKNKVSSQSLGGCFVRAMNVPVDSVGVNIESGSGIVEASGGYNIKTWKFYMDIGEQLTNDVDTENQYKYQRVRYYNSSNVNNRQIVKLPTANVATNAEWLARNPNYVPSNPAVNIKYYFMDTSKFYPDLTLETRLEGTKTGLKLLEVLDAPNGDKGSLQYSTKWNTINSALISASDYVSTVLYRKDTSYQTVQFKKAMPDNYELFIFYEAEDDESQPIKATPDFIRVSVDFPEVTEPKVTIIGLDETNIDGLDNAYVLGLDNYTQISIPRNELGVLYAYDPSLYTYEGNNMIFFDENGLKDGVVATNNIYSYNATDFTSFYAQGYSQDYSNDIFTFKASEYELVESDTATVYELVINIEVNFIYDVNDSFQQLEKHIVEKTIKFKIQTIDLNGTKTYYQIQKRALV